MSNPNSFTDYRAHRNRVVRQFSEYLAIYDLTTPVMDPNALPHMHIRAPRHIYTDEEHLRMLEEARRVTPENPVRGLTFHAMIGLAASCGLRISEVVGLDREDVDWKTETSLIRQSKFGKAESIYYS